MLDYLDDVSLADVQSVEDCLTRKLRYFKANAPYAYYEISNIETALEVLNDLEMELANKEC